MQNKYKLKIETLIYNFNPELRKNIRNAFKIFLNKNFSKAYFKIKPTKKYWKTPELTKCYFYIYSDKPMSINNFVKKFNFDFDKSAKNALWDHYYHSGFFIHKNINWALISKG